MAASGGNAVVGPGIEIRHASCVSVAGAGVLILGASGAGKSGLALQLLAMGAGLIADDRTRLRRLPAGEVLADCPEEIRGRIEVRGVGILGVAPAEPAVLRLVVDLDRPEDARLPPMRETEILGCRLPLLHNPATPHFPAAILMYLRGGRVF